GLDDFGGDQWPRRVEVRGRRVVGTDGARKAKLGGELNRLAGADQGAAGVEEFRELVGAIAAHATGNIGRRTVVAEELELVGLEVRNRTRGRWCIHRGTVLRLRRHDDDVVGAAQVALLQTLLEDQVERDTELIEGVPVPADLLRVAP